MQKSHFEFIKFQLFVSMRVLQEISLLNQEDEGLFPCIQPLEVYFIISQLRSNLVATT